MSELTDEERELRDLAEIATHGPWEAHPVDMSGRLSVRQKGDVGSRWLAHVVVSGYITPSQGRDNARFIAAASPYAVLDLLARIEELEERVRDFENDEHMRVRRLTK